MPTGSDFIRTGQQAVNNALNNPGQASGPAYGYSEGGTSYLVTPDGRRTPQTGNPGFEPTPGTPPRSTTNSGGSSGGRRSSGRSSGGSGNNPTPIIDNQTPATQFAFNQPAPGNQAISLVLQNPQLANTGTQHQSMDLENFSLPKPAQTRMTTQIKPPMTSTPKLFIGGYVQEGDVTGFVKDPETGKKIPVRDSAVYYEPLVDAAGNQVTGERKSRQATATEEKKLRDDQRALTKDNTLTEAYTNVDRVVNSLSRGWQSSKNAYNRFNEQLKEEVTYPLRDVATEIAAENSVLLQGIRASTKPVIEIPNVYEDVSRFGYGFSTAIINDVIENPAEQLILLGAGAGLGLGFKGAATGLAAIPKVGKYASTGFKTLAVSYGVWETASAIGTAAAVASQAESPEKAGQILGKTTKDIGLIGYGFYLGEKSFNIIKGRIRTRGMEELQVEQGIYPQAPTEKQLKMFQNNVYEEISNEAIAFHTTPDVFYKQGKITPMAGSSELPGLYASTQISTPFSKIPGSGSKAPDSFEKFLKAFLDSLAAETNPGVATLEPLGFREVGFRYTKVKQFEGQKNLGTKKNPKYAYFKDDVKPGFMDVPKMKTEIEAIARIEAGSYKRTPTATGQRYYTEIAGVRVPLDNFKFDVESLKKDLAKDIDNLLDLKSKGRENPMAKEIAKNVNDFLDAMKRDIEEPFNPSEYNLNSLKSGPEVLTTSKAASRSSRKAISSSLSSDISSEISQLSSSISSELSALSSAVSGSSSASSGSLSSRSGSSGASSGSSASSASSSSRSGSSSSKSGSSSGSSVSSMIQSYNNQTKAMYASLNRSSKPAKKSQNLGPGHNVYIKIVNTNRFEKINQTPVTYKRAKDIAQYYLDNYLARTTKIRKSGQAQEDLQFLFIPEGYYEQRKHTSREYRIKNKKAMVIDDEIIKKSAFLQDTPEQKRQLQAFRKQTQAAIKSITG